METGTEVPVHRHPTKDESFVILRGKVRSTTYNDDGSIIDSVVLSQEDGVYGVDIPKGIWHKLESLEPNSVIFECKEGPFVPHEEDGILELPESLPGNQPPQILQVHPGGTQPALLVEAQQEVDECRGDEARAGAVV